jgi:hypothetical protein
VAAGFSSTVQMMTPARGIPAFCTLANVKEESMPQGKASNAKKETVSELEVLGRNGNAH